MRDLGVMPIEAGVRKLTGELADVLGIDRGYLRVGSPADIAVFDWERLGPGPTRRVADLPSGAERLIGDAPTGLVHVLVNGVPIRLDGHDLTGSLIALPGQLLRG